MTVKYIDKGATISPCRKYRYRLWRTWDLELPAIAIVGLNPSTADAEKDDPTIRRCVRFAADNGYGKLFMVNLWGFRATDPRKLPGIVTREEIINWADVLDLYAGSKDQTPHRDGVRMVAAWGVHKFACRADYFLKAIPYWHRLALTKDGYPRHPLYLKAGLPFVPWTEREWKGLYPNAGSRLRWA